MSLYALDGEAPELDPESWAAPTATLIGRVRLKRDAAVWWGAVLRGDNEWITLGERSNIQDLACCHTDMGAPLTVGADVTVGHRAMLHGCTIGDGALIGMGATVLNHATIGEGALLGAGALVGEGKSIPPGVLALGAPAKVVRDLTEADRARILEGSASYVRNWRRFAAGCRPA